MPIRQQTSQLGPNPATPKPKQAVHRVQTGSTTDTPHEIPKTTNRRRKKKGKIIWRKKENRRHIPRNVQDDRHR